MDFKLISKNNIGTVVLLLLVIALSQARTFNFLIDSALGRAFLIIFILCLSYCNKILGIVGVLFIIIVFNTSMYSEGFENISTDASDNTTDASGNPTTQMSPDQIDQIKQMIQQQIQQKMSSNGSTSTDSTSTDSTSTDSYISKKSKNSKNTEAAEGFDILGIENNIKRGKQSNSIPVNNLMRDSDSISPYEGSSFLGNFSPF
jgi:hypothetical protein